MISATTSEGKRADVTWYYLGTVVVINHLDSPWFINTANLEGFFGVLGNLTGTRYISLAMTGLNCPSAESRQAAKVCAAAWCRLNVTSGLSEYELAISSNWMKLFLRRSRVYQHKTDLLWSCFQSSHEERNGIVGTFSKRKFSVSGSASVSRPVPPLKSCSL